jgi:hypothetical protein
LLLRSTGYSAPIWYHPDTELGWTLRPGVSGWQSREGRAFVESNADGWRDAEHSLIKAPDVYRIAILGDSYSEAMQVGREEAYWSLLPQRLTGCNFAPGKRIEVLNFGVSGYGTAQESLLLASKALPYQPDLVLLQFTNGNDVSDNSRALAEENLRPYFTLGENGALQIDNTFAAAPAFRSRFSMAHQLLRSVSDHSRVVQLLHTVRSQQAIRNANAHIKTNEPAAAGVEQGLEPLVLAAPRDKRWNEAWQITEKLIEGTHNFVRLNNMRFLVMTVPYAIQVHPDARVRAELQNKLGVPDLLYPDRRIVDLARRSGFDAVTIAPEMQRLADEKNIYFHGFANVGMGRGHWNADGHRVAADLVSRRLCGSPG